MPATETDSVSPEAGRPWWLSLLVFIGTFALLQYGWEAARGTALERLLVHQTTVETASALIRLLTPQIDAHAVGPHIVASGGGLNVLRGCEGVELLFLLTAALLAHPFDWRVRLGGWAGGVALIFVLNEARLLALFYSYREDRALFDQLHGLTAPVLMVAAIVVFFVALLHWQDRVGQAVVKPA